MLSRKREAALIATPGLTLISGIKLQQVAGDHTAMQRPTWKSSATSPPSELLPKSSSFFRHSVSARFEPSPGADEKAGGFITVYQ
jgi:hypothetical protein